MLIEFKKIRANEGSAIVLAEIELSVYAIDFVESLSYTDV